MRRAALYVHGRVVVADSHLGAYQSLTIEERTEYIVSGFIDVDTGEFDSDLAKDHFYNKEIYMVRHGETIDPDHPDPPISQQGQQQATQLAQQLVDHDLAEFECYTSPLLRCLQTADIIAKICKLNFVVEPSLMETPSFLKKDETYELPNRKGHFPNFRWPTTERWFLQQEDRTTFAGRVRTVLQRLPRKAILISHFGVISNMACLALCNERAIECGVPTASLTHIDNQEVKCLGWTCKPTEGTDETNLQDRPTAPHQKT